MLAVADDAVVIASHILSSETRVLTSGPKSGVDCGSSDKILRMSRQVWYDYIFHEFQSHRERQTQDTYHNRHDGDRPPVNVGTFRIALIGLKECLRESNDLDGSKHWVNYQNRKLTIANTYWEITPETWSITTKEGIHY